jgi:hypothetical protein
MRNDFCVFILTHGRPDRVHTYDTMMKSGYTGKVYIVIDDEDKKADEYRQRFGDKVLQFNKTEWAEKTDEGDNFQHRKAIVYARNACWDLAKQVGCRYFVQFDDDYTAFFIRHDSKYNYVSANLRDNLESVFEELIVFLVRSNATAIAMSQGGDHIGGERLMGDQQMNVPKLSRKCMNSWFCDVEKLIKFFGHMNEDVSAYVTYGHRGELFLTAHQPMLVQKPTQTTPGGMSDLYLTSGTYQKSFYTVMANPSCVQIGAMGDPRGNGYRIHHKINWHKAVPKIIDQKHQKARS